MDTSKDIVAGPETNFFLEPLSQHQLRLDRSSAQLASKLDINPDDVTQAIMCGKTSFEVFDEIMGLYSHQLGVFKSIWAEKTPRNCFSYHRLAIENPDTLFISTIRHGLDVVTSKIEGNHKRSGAYWVPVQRYVDCMMCIYSFNHPYHKIIRYENLVSDPVSTACDLFSFLSVPFQEDVVTHFNSISKSKDFSKIHQPKLKQEIQTTWIGRWKEKEHQRVVAEFMGHEAAVHWLERSGYSI